MTILRILSKLNKKDSVTQIYHMNKSLDETKVMKLKIIS